MLAMLNQQQHINRRTPERELNIRFCPHRRKEFTKYYPKLKITRIGEEDTDSIPAAWEPCIACKILRRTPNLKVEEQVVVNARGQEEGIHYVGFISLG
jgi:hypothetical protein